MELRSNAVGSLRYIVEWLVQNLESFRCSYDLPRSGSNREVYIDPVEEPYCFRDPILALHASAEPEQDRRQPKSASK